MNASDVVSLAVVVAVGIVPLAAVFIVAFLRGYTIHLSMWRRHRGDE